ncbi:inverse autotransporter beta-barrel domain-containing protein [Xenorhabdus kozodoii]|uniref:Inverse autotransporter beta-barrel domain-containing protein n=1 Tax=Xenorhabdus kozodoii TaxID=351676 RepID=A0A2D0KZM3_9GAMM|nr:inverse autotransporter beta-barrel domain-containing protein [Xenorhabdus kozodoii]
MLSYIVNIIRFFAFLCLLLLSSSLISAGADHDTQTEERYLHSTEQKNNINFGVTKKIY